MNYQNDAEVEVKDIIYEKNADGFYDTLSGKFVVHIYRDHQETEAIITFFKCAKGVTEICTENSKKFVESLDCNRFLTDDSGPWHMFGKTQS